VGQLKQQQRILAGLCTGFLRFIAHTQNDFGDVVVPDKLTDLLYKITIPVFYLGLRAIVRPRPDNPLFDDFASLFLFRGAGVGGPAASPVIAGQATLGSCTKRNVNVPPLRLPNSRAKRTAARAGEVNALMGIKYPVIITS
jgi:hypothetical protein